MPLRDTNGLLLAPVATPSGGCVHELLEAQARRTPNGVAVEFRDQRLTYRELDERSTKLANHLRRLGVTVESLVGVCLDRSAEMVIAVLGIMKAGGAYVPLDPSYPAQRLAYMLQDSGAAVSVAGQEHLRQFAGYTGTVVNLEESARAIASESSVLPPGEVLPENLAYVIYTSGSTGIPKGVMVPHSAVVNLLESMREDPGLTHNDALLAVTTLSFDIAVLELFLPLIGGGRVIVADRETASDGTRLAAELTKRRATVMQATPATWRMLIGSGWRGDKGLKALCGGEALSRELADSLLDRVGGLWNMYGPTETTVWSLIARVELGAGPVPIGRPIANTTAYLLDASGKPVPQGAIGTLHIGGKGLARGYKGRPELTGQHFISRSDEGCGDERIYNTGDLARSRADGSLEFLGRLDSQVKIRGYRVELGEIESALRQHEGVSDAFVAMHGSGIDEQRLVAYVVANKPGVASASNLRQHARAKLPAYMLPSAFVILDALPLTPNGKVDRKALPAPGAAAWASGREKIAPKKSIEATLQQIFEELLDVSPVSVTDDFFELGGHSLIAVRLVARIEKETGHNIPVTTLLQAPTVEKLAREIENRTYTAAWSSLVELREGNPAAEPLFCIHWLGAKLVTFQQIAAMLRDDRPVYGLQPRGLDGSENPLGTVTEIAAEYVRAIRGRRAHGPYHLAGSCLGGVVAFEVAQQLIAEGEKVGLLLIIDASMPGPLKYLHERTGTTEWLDWYFGEFLLSPSRALKRWWQEAADRLFGGQEDGSSSRAAERVRAVVHQAASLYRPMLYPGKVTLMMCSDGPVRAYEDRRLAWSSVAEGGLEIHIVPGNHGTMEKEPNIRVLGKHFQSCFDRWGASQPAPILVAEALGQLFPARSAKAQ